MKRAGAFLAVVILLTGCGASRRAETFERRRAELAACEAAVFNAEITAHWEDASTTFSVRAVYSGGETAATVTAPEAIAGVTFRRGAKGGTVEFDGLVLDFDAGHTKAVAPCEGPALLITALTDGWPLAFGREGEYDTVSLEAPGGETVTVWTTSDGTPVCAEIAREGVKELTLTIEHWEMR